MAPAPAGRRVSPAERALLRFVGLWAVLAGIGLLERTAYRAGIVDTGQAAADCSDVVAAHEHCCAGVA